MKFFGWGRKKDPPPIEPAYQEFKDSDAATSINSPGSAVCGSVQLVGQDDQPKISTYQRVAIPPQSQDFFGEAVVDMDSETWEVRLQETIRFVFRHEQEGLLAIGTFALDQLAGMTHIDGRRKSPAATEHRVNPRRNSFSSVEVVIREVRSSDDDNESHHSMRSPIPGCKRKESYPVFGDHDASSGVHCRGLSVGGTKSVTDKNQYPPCISYASANMTTQEAVSKPRGETRGHADSSTTLDHDHSDSEGFYSPGICGLFRSRSRRTQKDSGKEKRKKPPEKQKTISYSCEQLNEADSTKGSLGAQLGRLWRSACTGSSDSAKVSPEKKPIPCPPQESTPEPVQAQV
ncbi:hypothetical protein KC19_1G182800 [Ceratodon purpureus]|uniref:Uncharacterized protein n=1 Tax=Ceratodon purpureus TaxID=3225 RepID=A0A8T0J9M1_CERPU|nr:hypothetical protein KC19_1G182800 [Ceratodon purpureus]